MKLLLYMLVVISLAGCHGAPFTLPYQPQAWVENVDYEVIGNTESSAVGFLLFGFIPIVKNDMYQRAYEKALASSSGTNIFNPTIEEYWYFTPLGNIFKVNFSGLAVKRIKKAPKQ
ncbi:MAG: hypothetical protein HGB32_15340 [Geobacteraceae bacterium]|nr:hypothetical protein [Geobacteraceae bacterium]NTW81497.1 hypothetical protein [Geobacteraceae bacterium]